MNPLDIAIDQDQFTEKELEALGNAILLVEKLKEDKPLWNAIDQQMKKKVGPIKSIKDLRLKAQDVAMQSDDMGE